MSGARSLDEVLEIYVPSFTKMGKGKTGDALGVRGIISDRNNKILLLVNGKIMNERTLLGATSERMLTMLGDINKIEVIQSPQSSLYGPGAISAVINIFTKDAKTSDKNNEVNVNYGGIDQFVSTELRHSKVINENMSYSIYYGVDKAWGAEADTKFSFNGNDANGDTIITDQATIFPFKNLNSSNQDELRHKAHVHFDYKDLSTWVRYTKGGMNFAHVQPDVLNTNLNDALDSVAIKYDHITAFSNYKHQWGDFGIDARLSVDQLQNKTYQRNPSVNPSTSSRESEVYSRVVLSYNHDDFGIAIGPAFSHETFGNPAFGDVDSNMRISGQLHGRYLVGDYADSWSTDMWSVIGEAQYSIKDNLSVLAGARIDKTTYTNNMLSPRASLVWIPSRGNLIRFQYSKSNRRAEDSDLRFQYLKSIDKNTSNSIGDVETINFYELSSEIKLSDGLKLQPSIYYGDIDLVAWVGSKNKSLHNGSYEYGGVELNLLYRKGRNNGRITHSIVKAIGFDLYGDTASFKTTPLKNNITASIYGYGNDFHNYPVHLTKLYYTYKFSPKISAGTNLQVNWGYQGAKDAANYAMDSLTAGQQKGYVKTDGSSGWERAFGISTYLNLSFMYKFTEQLHANVFAYNVLGLFDDNLNKRNEFQRVSQYRIQPTSFAIRLGYDF